MEKKPEIKPDHTHPVNSPEIQAEEKAKKTSTSKGEKLFDWVTYGGIAFAGVFVATLPWTYFTKYGSGKKFHDWMTTALKKKGVSKHVAEQTFNTAILGSLGNAAIIPVKVMENYKPELVEKFNAMLGDKSHDASVDQDPKQTWTSLIAGRVAAYTAVFVSLQGAVAIWGGDKFQKFEEKFAEQVCKVIKKPTHTPGLAKTVANETKAFRYGKIGALDVFATAAATILLYSGSRFFAKKNEPWHAKHTAAPETPEQPAPQTALESAIVPEKRFTDTIQPKTQIVSASAREATYADTVATQKAHAHDKSPALPA